MEQRLNFKIDPFLTAEVENWKSTIKTVFGLKGKFKYTFIEEDDSFRLLVYSEIAKLEKDFGVI
jgi:hypothetical protein